MVILNKYIIILLLSVLILSSCRSKKKTFSGKSTLECVDYNGMSTNTSEKKKTKWRLVLYKDGDRVGARTKKGKSRLFKKKK